MVGRDNVLAAVVPWGPGGERFEWTYGQRGSLALPDALGETLLRAVGVVPRGSGVLVFFPSYSMMATVAKRLQATGVLGRLREAAWVGEEARERGAEDAVTQFRESVRRGRTAVLMAPARGKVSEGMDFRDDECRLVLQVGIPFPNARDAKVVLKKEYNNANGRDMGLPSGDEWYTMQAFR